MTESDFADWYARERPRVLAALTALSGDVDAATDATDEAFARAFARWDRVAGMETAGGWTYRVALNVLRRTMRRRQREATIGTAHASAIAPAPDAHLWSLVRTLPPRQRTAIVLRYVADRTEAEIAAAMGIRRSTVASTLTQARARLGTLLQADADADAEQEAEHA